MEIMPDELISKIFTYLDTKSLTSASKVCHRWMSVVTTNQSLHNKLSLLLLIKKEKVKQVSDLIPSCYKSIKIFNNNDKLEGSKYIENVLIDHRSTLLDLEIRGHLKSYSIFYTFLKPVPQITHLTITNFYDEECDWEKFPSTYNFEPIDLPTLTFLEIQNSMKILPLLEVPQLETFKLYMEKRFLPMFYLATDNYENERKRIEKGFLNFMKKCKNLKCLHLDAIPYHEFYVDYSFNLEEVSLQCDYLPEQQVINFLEGHKHSLKRAAIMTEGPSRVVEFLLKECRLSYLDIELSLAPPDLQLKINNYTIKQLEIPVFPIVRQFVCSLGPRVRNVIPGPGIEVIKACVNLESLGIYEYHKDLVNPISEMKNLKTLRVYFPPNSVPDDASISMLQIECFEVDWIPRPVPYVDHLLKFLPLLPSLKRFKINKFDNANEEVFEKLIFALPHLIELHLGTTIDFSENMMNAIYEARKNGYAINRLSFLENGRRAKEFASFRVKNFYFKSYEEESGYFELNRFKICENRKFEKTHANRKGEFNAIKWEIKN